jgi:GMP synthase-like glutamine amidotransferase
MNPYLSTMKTGLLICDTVNDAFRHIDGDYPDMFRNLLPELEIELFRVHEGEFPESPDVCDAWIMTGSRFSVYDQEDWILRLKSFVKEIYESDKTYVGVCFGHQMLGEALGGKVEKASIGWNVGIGSFEILRQEDWMQPVQSSLNLLMMCQDQVVEMPPDSALLAKSPTCPVSMFRVGDRMLGIQAHPEFSKAYNRALMEVRVDRMGKDTVDKGIRSLELTVDQRVIAAWIMEFLT